VSRRAAFEARGQSAGSGAPVRSATRSTALRDRGLAAISAAVGLCALPTRASGGRGRLAVDIDRRARRGSPPHGALAQAKKRLTIRSSSEWKLITASRPPGASSAAMRGNAIDTSASSRFTAIRRAWNVRAAGF
jgi:hypothetical protein